MSTTRKARSRVRRIVALVVGVGLVVGGVGVAALNEQTAKSAQAASVLDGFDPANIIDDAVMFNGTTMTAAQIQTFLNAKQPSCAAGATCLKSVTVDMPAMTANAMCQAMPGQANASAAQVIAAVAKACDVNPQVILVMLQKEQTLITGRMPYSSETVPLIYRKATGLGCPDTAACDPSKYGLFNQLYGVAYWLVRYTTPPGTTGPGWTSYNWFPVGRPSGVLYNPSAACGAQTLTIKNKATAALYYYTPYVPNTAALAAGWGLGNSCSAYGNRNFYLYFTTWFGSTHYIVTGVINTYWTAHKSDFGDPAGNAVAVTANGGGTAQDFAKGMIYTSRSGTFGLTGANCAEYTAQGGPAGPLGWPRKALIVRGGANAGTAQPFQNGTIYSSAGGTVAVAGPVYSKYGSTGYELGGLGWPVGDAVTSTTSGGATWQSFQRGRIVVTGAASTVLSGDLLTMWLRRNAETGTLGWPIADATTVTSHGRTGTAQNFQSGVITVQGSVRTVTGATGSNYLYHGGPTGTLGWPTGSSTKSTANGGGWWQHFQGGDVFWSAATGSHALYNSPTLQLFNARGGTSGSLGWLQTSGHDRSGIGGAFAIFQNGRIYSSRVGTNAVLGDILQRYLSKGGPKGTLGWPTSNAHSVHGATVQTFQHGSITWTKTGGAKASRS